METGKDNILLYVDISATASPAYTQMKPLHMGYDQGETMDSWFDLLSNIMNNVKTGIDPTWSTSLKFSRTDPVAQFILGKEFATGEDATASIKIINLLKGTTGKQIDFTATFSNITYDATTPEVVQIDFDLKVYEGSTFAETTYAGSI
jgi:hypothetical protein